MDNNELFDQVIAAMKDQTSVLEGMIKASEARTGDHVEKLIRETETRIIIKIEHEVAGRIDALFDGYKLTHEKQYELEHEFEALKRRLERLEILVEQTA